MPSIVRTSSHHLTPAAFALYEKHRQDIYRRTDRMFALLMVVQWIFGIVAALVISPRTWVGTTSYTHPHLWVAVILGGVISGFPIMLALVKPGHVATRHVIAVAQMLTSSLLIHLTGGRIETHFHVFGSLAFLAFYYDWTVLIPAALVVALDHLIRGIYFPQSVYGVMAATPWRSLEHAAWVVFEEVFLISACLRGQRDMREIAQRAADLNAAKDIAESAARVKSEFLANMSHEIRTPLNAILGFADLMRRGADQSKESERQEWLGIIYSSGKHLLEVINEILDLSKLESGKMEIERVRCAPAGLISNVVSLLRPRAEEKGLNLELRYDGEIPATIYIDPTRLRQLLINIVGNAIKFTESGWIQLIACLHAAGSTRRLRIRVVDTGIGIEADKLTGIFDPFVQADTSTTRRYGGTGLGLAISKRIAEALGGDLSVISEPGKGSVFTCEVDTGPLDGIDMVANPLTEALVVEKPDTSSSPTLRCRILVVDDGSTNRKLIEIVLRRAGATVLTAENGQAAVDLAIREDLDLILMDMQMPVMDGYTATQELRREGLAIPIIALTANAMKEDQERCLAAGCSSYLSKPLDPARLLRAVAFAVGEQAGEENQKASPLSKDQTSIRGLRSTLPTDDADFREVVEEFVVRLRQQLDKILAAWDEKNIAELLNIVHWLKGAAGTAGFSEFTAPAARLEKLAKQEEMTSIGESIAELIRLADQIVVEPASQEPPLATCAGGCEDVFERG